LSVSQRERRKYRRSLNPPVFKPRKRQIVTFRMDESEYGHIEASARKRGLNVSTFIRYYIREV